MIDYSIISKSTVPMKTIMPPGKWIEILNNLGMDKSLRFNLANIKRANSVRCSMLGSFRLARLRRLNIHYKVRTMIVHNPDESYTLYIWKEKNGDTSKKG